MVRPLLHDPTGRGRRAPVLFSHIPQFIPPSPPSWIANAWETESSWGDLYITAETNVSEWLPVLGNVSLQNANVAQQPLASTVNGRPSVLFDGVADSLIASAPISFGTAWTIACVFKMESTATSIQTLINADTGGNRFAQFIRRESSGGESYRCLSFNNAGSHHTASNLTTTTTEYKLIVVTRDEFGLTRVYENRVTDVAEAYLAGVQKASSQTIRVGASEWFGTPNQFFSGHILGIYIDPTTAHEWWALDELFSYCAFKWGTEAPSNYAPVFPGMDYIQLRPSDLLGTLSIGDPIGDFPMSGGLASGSFIATGNARPVLAYDWAGRVVVQHDGVNDILDVDDLSISLPVGCSFFAVRAQKNTGTNFAGLLRADAGSSGVNNSLLEEYFYYPLYFFEAESNRLTGYQTGASVQRLDQGTWSTGVQASSVAGTTGLYISGTRVTAALSRPLSTITGMQIAGYNQDKFKGSWHDWIFYNGALTAIQSAEVGKYIQYQHMSARAIPGMPDFLVHDWRVDHLTGVTVDTEAPMIPDGIDGKYNLLPASAATRGIYRIINGHPCIQFDAVDDVYQRAGLDTLAGRNYTMVSLWINLTHSADTRLWGHDNIASGSSGILRQTSGTYQSYNNSWLGLGQTGELEEPELVGYSTKPTGVEFRRNGVKTTAVGISPNTFPSGTSTFGIGKKYLTNGIPPDGYFFGQWAVARPLNDADYLELENWIKSLYPGLFP